MDGGLMDRPIGVVGLSVIFLIIGLILLSGSVYSVRILSGMGLLQVVDAGLLVAAAGFGVVYLASAIGLFALRNWARRLLMALSLIGVAVGLAAVFIPSQLFSASILLAALKEVSPYFNYWFGGVSVTVGLAGLWYLSKPRVKFIFGW
nr:hypothetical protein [Candidatus Freyrarchaeum guaymaensis]